MRESNKANKDLNNKSKNDEKEAGKVVLQSSWSAREEEILKFWDEKQIFEKSLEKNKGAESFVFYDGPPFATGLPHWGSLLSSVAKDVIPRYKTMKGMHVRRRWGWDTHGLPIENMIEKKLKLEDKTDIENKVGIEKFNYTCRRAVLQYADDWKQYIDRIGRWVEFDNAYKTMDNEYMESVWHFLKTTKQKGILYEGYRVLNFCPHCQTPLSKAEIAMDNSYKDVKDISVTAKFELVDEPGTFVLAWTTTPWTLPGNVALAVGEDIDYVKVRVKETTGDDSRQGLPLADLYLVAKDRLKEVFKDEEVEILEEMKGTELVGKSYKPIFDYYSENLELKNRENGWKICGAGFVTTEDGTGVVHIAPAFGEDDFSLGKRDYLPFVQHVNTAGEFKKELDDLAGIKVKQKGDYVTADIKILKLLQEKNVFFNKKNINHSYPHCYRCDTPLLNYAISSWFLDLQKDKEKYVSLNDKVNWIPSNLKNGRVKNLLEGAPDWTISRNRYWATPLPFWKNKKTGELHVIGSVDELKEYTKKSGNKYFVMRHGQSDSNVDGILSGKKDNPHHLTSKGEKEALSSADELKSKKIDIIISSPFVRTTETAKIVAKEIGFNVEDIIYDERLSEINSGEYEGRSIDDYHDFFGSFKGMFTKRPKDGENVQDVKERVMGFLYDTDSKYNGKNILIVTHASPIWMLLAGVRGDTKEETIALWESIPEGSVKTAEFRALDFVSLPHNAEYELDLHRPYIDDVALVDKDGDELKRVSEVVDCWVESASMPFAEYHYPFENKEVFENRRPGDFVSEYIAQTRTWFNYMHTVAGIMFDDVAFKNVLTTGNILAEDGTKMSKSKGNYTDPLELMNKTSADAARFYMINSPVMLAQDLEFVDGGVAEIQNKVINLLLNVYKFYELYQGKYSEKVLPRNSKNVLDVWILARLEQVIIVVTENMDKYNLPNATREIKEFLADFSKWFIRRSRGRVKVGSVEDVRFAISTIRFVLEEVSKIMAPITPFISDYVYRGVSKNRESVHLEDWPSFVFDNVVHTENEILSEMKEVRKVVSLGLEARASFGVKVRQPLSKLKVKNNILESKTDLIQLILDEVNVKEVVFDETIEEDVVLDTSITPQLKKEGDFREFLRYVQDARKKAGLSVDDFVTLSIGTSSESQGFLEEFLGELKSSVLAKEVKFIDNIDESLKVSIGDMVFNISISKVS